MENKNQPESLKELELTKGKKILLGVGIGFLVLIIAGGILSYYLVRGAVKKVEETDQSTPFERFELSLRDLSQINSEKSREQYQAGIGDTLYDSEVEIKINSVEPKDKFENQEPYLGNQYLILNMTLKNITDKEVAIYTSNFSIRDDKYNKFYVAFLNEGVVDDPISAWQFIPHDKEVTGNIVFEVKSDSSGLVLEYNGTKDLLFDLKNK